jgi:hypothetical protein
VLLNSVRAGVVFVNLKVIRSFGSLSLYVYVHDGFSDLLFTDLRRHYRFSLVRKFLKRFFAGRYKKHQKKRLLIYQLAKKITRRYPRKFFFLFLKNKMLRLYWNTIKSLILAVFPRFICNIPAPKVYVLSLSKNNVNANIVGEFFFVRLKQYYTVWEVLRNVNYLLQSLMRRKRCFVRGYKILCSGRFSRKQRATYSWRVFGSLAVGSMKSKLDYTYRTIALKYSTCTIKVWVRLGQKRKSVNFVV